MKVFANNNHHADELDAEAEAKREEIEWFLREDYLLRRNKTELPLQQHRKSQEGSSLFLGYINLINQSKILPKYLTPTVKLKAVEKEHKERCFKSLERDQPVRPKKLVKEVCSLDLKLVHETTSGRLTTGHWSSFPDQYLGVKSRCFNFIRKLFKEIGAQAF